MIQIINDTLDTEYCYSCVTRCRRFGKSMAAKMLYAYYDKSCDSRHLFEDLTIAKMPSFEKHLNKLLAKHKKYNTAVDTAIDQIKQRNYPEKVREYTDNLLLVGISYDLDEKVHECRIEKL